MSGEAQPAGVEEADVVVVGAGLAGLTAALRLRQAGRSVVVLEARDRVGGRLLAAEIGAGEIVEVGGQWVGPTQERVLTLLGELGIGRFPTFDEGRSVLELEGRLRHYSGTIPRVGPFVLADIALTRLRLQRLAARIDPARPWQADGAAALDSRSLWDWLAKNMRTGKARTMMRVAGRTIWGAEPEEISLLHALFYLRAAGGLDALLDVEGGAQQWRIEGGSQRLATTIAAQLGPDLRLNAAVTAIASGGDGVIAAAGGLRIRARDAVVAVPAPLRGRIRFDPAPPGPAADPGALAPFGRLIKAAAVYETPFWRDQGLSGEALSDSGPTTLTFDNSPPSGAAGVLLGFVGGADADEHVKRDEGERRERVLACFARLFGERALAPHRYLEQEWSAAAEPWSGGGPTFVVPPGGWTRLGPALAEPAGPIHWAGTETASRWAGFMDGAVSSGERAAAAILAARG
jgi:monoamine oxidase